MMTLHRWLAGLAVAALFGTSPARVLAQCSADAGPATASVCAGATLNLNGTGTGNAPLSFSWSGSTYLSGTSSATATFTHPVPLAASTVVNLTLTVTDDDGCTDTDVIAVTVNPAGNAVLTSTGPEQVSTFNGRTTFSICDPSATWPFAFQDQSAVLAGATRTINWGDGSPVENPAQGWALNHTYDQGLYTLVYSVTLGSCTNTQQYTVFLGTNPGGGISTDPNTTICTGGSLPFYLNSVISNSPGTTYLIDFGDGQDTLLQHPPPSVINHTYSLSSCGVSGGQYTVYFTAQNPCDATQGQISPVRVSETPQAQFTVSPNDTACVGSTVTFTDQSLGAQAPSCLPPKRVWSITPATGWTVVSGPLGSTNGNPSNPTLWTNGAAALGVSFTVAGTYTITDLTGNSCGINSLDRTICVEAPPQPAFTLAPATGCAPFTSLVDNTSTSPNSCRTVYAWNVSTSGGACGSGPAWNYTGGTSASSIEPQFQFTQAGTYSIQLEATNTCGTFQQTEVVTANAPPQVDVADLVGICATQCVDPSATVQNCGSTISTYAWSFSGGTPNTANTLDPPQICYATATSSSISLTVTNACGSATDATTLAVGSLPAQPVIASNSPVCAGQILSLSASSSPGVSFSWSGPNGFSSNQPSVTIPGVTAASAGVYSVVAISGGCSGPAATVNVQVVAAPTITVTPSSDAICNGESASFTASGAGNYQWYIGATLVGTGPLFNTSPAITTSYTVSGDLGGCPGSTTVPVTVYPVTNVNAGSDQTFCDQTIPVTLSAFPSPGTWSGPNVSPGGVFTPVTDQLGPVVLTYTHTDGNGCINDDQVTITVQDLTLIADAGVDTFFCQGTTAVTLPATPPGGTWVGAGPGGQFTPSSVGAFIVNYNYGTGTCATSDQVEVQVLPAPTLNLPADFVRCADAAPVVLTATPAGGTWSGAGVSGPPYQFDPGAVGNGVHSLSYAFTDASGCSSTGSVTATVNALPVVDAGPDVQLCDQPIPFQLSATPVGGTWSATILSITAAGVVTPNGVGSDVITYTYVDPGGCSAQDQITVDVIAIAEPAYAGEDTAVCVNSGSLQLNATPLGGTWSGPQVSFSGLVDTSTPGTYVLTYSFGSATCLLQDQVTVVVNALPVVDAGDEIATCLDGGMQVLTATPPGGTWSGLGVDAAGNFDPLLADPGGNPAIYSYTDPATGCSNSDATVVTVNPLPLVDMDHDPVACAGVAFPFINNSTGATSFEWDFGDGSGSFSWEPQHVFASPGTYDIRLIAITGADCRDTVYSTLEVWDVPQAAITLSTDTGCGPLEVSFVNNSLGEGLSYVWEFGGLDGSADQNPPPFTFPPNSVQAVDYDVSLTVTNVCGQDVATVPVTVIPPPTAEFGPNLNEYCSFADVPFGNASYGEPTAFEWLFGDGTSSTDPGPVVTHAYVAGDDPLNITVTLIATNVCGTDSAFQNITILPNQVNAFFNADPVEGCGPLTVNLTQFSAGDTAFYWELGDGDLSTLHDLSHTYTEPGTYTIELFAYGCGFDSFTTDVTVYEAPETNFSYAPVSACAGEPFTFTNQTPNVASLAWDFGDGNGSTSTAPTHTYAAGGTYDVTLTAELIGTGCTASSIQQVVVQATPVAAISADPASGCIDLPVAFSNASTDADFSEWSFGDGNTSNLEEPFHTYTTAGTYTARLIASSLNGCADTTTTTIVAHPLPTSLFTLSSYESCGPTSVVQTLNASLGAIGYAWDLGNGNSSELNQPEVVYTEPGSYTITLVSSNQFGCTDTARSVFVQHPTPEARFTVEPQPGCVGYPISFVNASVNATAFQWDLGDGTTSSLTFPLHSYGASGVYGVQLIAYGAGGCTDTLDLPGAVLVHPRPTAAYTTDTLESLPNALQFRNLSQGAIDFVWDFDDGEGSTAIHPLHVFPADGGAFLVCLVGVNDFGCPDTACTLINVPGDPNVFVPNAFTPNGDSRNDGFRPVLNGFVGWNYHFMVFDRWGLKAYETRDPAASWDGTRNGSDSPVDVYVWKLIVERDGDARDFVGHVTLVR